MSQVTLENAHASLPELLEQLNPGEEVEITRDEKSFARIIRTGDKPVPRKRPAPGMVKGLIIHMSDDFDAPLEEFKEYTG